MRTQESYAKAAAKAVATRKARFEASAASAYADAVNGTAKLSKKDFATVYAKACAAAEKAGDEWVASHTKPAYVVKDGFSGKVVGQMLDVCGFAYVQMSSMVPAFSKWAKAQGLIHYKWLDVKCEKYRMRQEMGLGEAQCAAAAEVLRSYGIECYMTSRID